MTRPCPVTETWNDVLLTCVLTEGHDGEHWCGEFQEVEE